MILKLIIDFLREKFSLTYYVHVTTDNYTTSRHHRAGPLTQVILPDGAYLEVTLPIMQSTCNVLTAPHVGPASLLHKLLVHHYHLPIAINILLPKAQSHIFSAW